MDVRVSPVVYSFFLRGNPTNIYELKPNEPLHKMLFSFLQLVPEDYKPMSDDACFIRFSLVRYENCYVVWRNYLDEYHQNIIRKFLNDYLKCIFKNYMFGYCCGGGIQKDGIIDFFEVYDIKWTDTDFETFKKSWDRSDEKMKWKSLNNKLI